MPRRRRLETPKILPDLPLATADKDHFHFDEFAATLSRLIADKTTRTPLAIGIHGSWGSGKTSLLRRIQKMLDPTVVLADVAKPAALEFVNDNENPQAKFRVCRTVWFNAWKYADEDQLLVALVRVIVQAMSNDDFVSKAIGKLLDPSYPRRDVVNTVLSWFSIKVGNAQVGLSTGTPQPTVFAEKTALLDQFEDAFNKLMAAWVHRTLDADKIDPAKGVLVIFIDDLDRCLPEKTVQVLEAVKLFLDKEGCVFVLGADRDVTRQAVESYYQNSRVTGQNAGDYLEKIIQLRFDLPMIDSARMEEYLSDQKVESAMLQRWQTLVAAAEVNPRRVKSVINDLNLQWAMAYNSGQAARLNRDDFICWQALMHAAPPNFIQRVQDLDDHNEYPKNLDTRVKFIKDALTWANGQGDENLSRVFQEYVSSLRLKRVLQEIDAFQFFSLTPPKDAIALDSIVHMTATIAEEKAAEAEQKLEAPAEKAGEKAAPETVSENRINIGGIEFIKVPAGKFIMGSKNDNQLAKDTEKPQHSLELPDYWMARFLLTNEQYAAYVGNDKHPLKDWENKKNHPVVNVSWNDAMAYCKWFNATYAEDLKKYSLTLHLPTEAQWEKAARGEYGNEWPWGNEFDSSKCNSREGNKVESTPVGAYSPQGDSPYGCADIAGNVLEWTHSLWREYPYQFDDGREKEDDAGSHVVRGGAFLGNGEFARCATRSVSESHGNNPFTGFRVCASPA
jgi:formylglycine-generating enzyme required for sulfatase activity